MHLQLDEVLLAVDDGELALLVELADVAGLEPALPARRVLEEALPGQVGVVVVTLGDGLAAQQHLAYEDSNTAIIKCCDSTGCLITSRTWVGLT